MLPLLVTVLPHVGGLPTPVPFTSPVDVGLVADQSFVITWDDADNDPTGRFYFYYKTINRKPSEVDHTMLGGTVIPPTDGVAAMDATDQLTWDTSAVPSGSYYLYGVTLDEPLVPIFAFSPGPVTIRHPGDPLFPAVKVPEPDGIGDIVDSEYTLTWRASGAGPMTAAIQYADLREEGQPLHDLASGVAMTDVGGGVFTGEYVWDLSSHPSGAYYYVLVTVTDGAGRTHAAYSPSTLIIYRPIDGGPGEVDGGATPDAGGGGGDGGGAGSGCSCATASRGGPGSLALLGIPALVLVARRRRRAQALSAPVAMASACDSHDVPGADGAVRAFTGALE